VLAHIGLTTKKRISYTCKEPTNIKVNWNDITTEQTKEYKQIIENSLMDADEINFKNCEVITEQDHWNNIVNASIKASDIIFSTANNKRKTKTDSIISALSIEQKELRLKLNSEVKKNKRKAIQKQRNSIMKRIQFIKREIEEDKLLEYVKDIENSKDDSRKMFQVIRLNNYKKK